ncbi:MAG: GNAT family N-acetyltransferase [Candidatus Pacebacteria bacterium]|nr:GNAT family N-acetyltransferase [Candidatus Paceibacterota bacterium]
MSLHIYKSFNLSCAYPDIRIATQQGEEMKSITTSIREAQIHDFDWVADLMHNSLEQYYGGDHRAHAKRIFDAHMAGGHDNVGFFSFEQRMFIIEANNTRAGMIHLVGKRQSTYKISPIIVAPAFQGQFGIGSQLLKYAEKYIRSQNSRQIYCTVAEKNKSAMQFFVHKGFIRAGSSDSHYKSGVVETMLYKPLYSTSKIISLDQLHVSVVLFDETNTELRKQVGRLLLEKLPESFEGITDEWVNALFNGYSRRHAADINAKYKLIYVATDSTGRVKGVAGATPKKGNPIKVMPFIATNIVAFEAMLIDIPYQLVPYGHKLYIHINPTADEVTSLQRLGWKLDAALPSAYHPGIITQQWSLHIGETTMKTMRIKKRFFDLISSGKKTLEVRVGYNSLKRINAGEDIRMVTHTSSCVVRVNAVRHYQTFEAMLAKESYERISPDASSSEDVLNLLKNIYAKDKEKLGVIVFDITPTQKK